MFPIFGKAIKRSWNEISTYTLASPQWWSFKDKGQQEIYFLLKNSCKKNILLIWPSLTFKWVVKNQKLTLKVRFRGFLTTRSYVSESQIKKMFFYNWFLSKNIFSVDPCSQNYTSEITLIIIHSNSKIHKEKKTWSASDR